MLVRILKLLTRTIIRLMALIGAYNVSVRNTEIAEVLASLSIAWPYGLAFVSIGLVVDFSTRSERSAWRFVSTHDIIVIVRNATIVALIFLVVSFLLDRAAALPRSTLFLAWMLDIAMFTGVLLIRRAVRERAFGPALLPFLFDIGRQSNEGPLLLIGSLETADSYLKDQSHKDQTPYRPMGIITLAPTANGSELRGVKVIGSVKDANVLLKNFPGQDGKGGVLFLDDAIVPADLDAEVLGDLRARGVRLLRRPRLVELTRDSELHEFDIEELLSRAPVSLALDEIKALISGSRVLVTGAGGSIGSEICRQVAALGCSHLTLLDNSEFLIFKIDLEIGHSFPTLSRAAVLCDIRDATRLDAWVAAEQPDIIFHAAALKHVPLVELHPCEGVLTNIMGTWNVVSAAKHQGVRHMVFISTDKAVDPSNVMGATKRLAEAVVRGHQSASSPTRFSVVRFGNVLGSAGSVVPTFSDQIARGGPVTVTHADVERYFMTIPEAVQLVLHATATGARRTETRSGVFVLDMGAPVKIMALAQRMIDLNARAGGQDIKIQITGLRPGEKLTEQLVDSTEEICRRELGVFEVIDRRDGMRLNGHAVDALVEIARTGNSEAARALIFETLSLVRRP